MSWTEQSHQLRRPSCPQCPPPGGCWPCLPHAHGFIKQARWFPPCRREDQARNRPKTPPSPAEPAAEELPSVMTRVLLCKVVGGREQSRKAVSGPSTWEESRGSPGGGSLPVTATACRAVGTEPLGEWGRGTRRKWPHIRSVMPGLHRPRKPGCALSCSFPTRPQGDRRASSLSCTG